MKLILFFILFLNISCAAMKYQRLESWHYIIFMPVDEPKFDCSVGMVGVRARPWLQLWDGNKPEVRQETARYFIGKCCKSGKARFVGEAQEPITGKSTKDNSDVQSSLFVIGIKCVE